MIKKPIVLLCLALAGCATTQSLPVEDRSRTFEEPYDRVFRAVVQMLTEEGYAVTEASAETGVINTDYKQNSGLEAAFIGRRRNKVTALVSDNDAGTKVILTLALEQGSGFGYASESMTSEAARKYYNDLFDKITQRL